MACRPASLPVAGCLLPVVFLFRMFPVLDQAVQQFANQFYDALLSQDGRYTVKQAYDIAVNTVDADNPNAPPQGDQFVLLPLGLLHPKERSKNIFHR